MKKKKKNNQKGFTHIAIAIGAFAIAAVVFVGAWWLLFGNSNDDKNENLNINSNVISNFDECIAAGYPAMESYPRQCSDGTKTFTEVIINNQNLNTNTEISNIDTSDLDKLVSYPLNPGGSDKWAVWRYASNRIDGDSMIRIYEINQDLVEYETDEYETFFFKDDGYLVTNDDDHGLRSGGWTGKWTFTDAIDQLLLTYDDGIQKAYTIKTLEPDKLELVETIPASPSTTNEWQTYTNDKYSFMYPNDWTVIYEEVDNFLTVNSVATISPPEITNDFLWGVWEYPLGTDIETLIARQGDQFDDRKEVRETIQVGGKNATKVSITTQTIDDWESIQIYIPLDYYIIVIGNGAVNNMPFDDFVDSFEFTSNASLNATENWQTYSNDVYGFSFKFPSEWNQIIDSIPTEIKYTNFNEGFIAMGDDAVDNNRSYPYLFLQVKPMGAGSSTVNKTFTVERVDGKYSIISERISDGSEGFGSPKYYSVRMKETDAGYDNDNVIYLTVTSSIKAVESASFDRTIEEIIKSFEFTI